MGKRHGHGHGHGARKSLAVRRTQGAHSQNQEERKDVQPGIVVPSLTGAALWLGVAIGASQELGAEQFGWDLGPRLVVCGECRQRNFQGTT